MSEEIAASGRSLAEARVAINWQEHFYVSELGCLGVHRDYNNYCFRKAGYKLAACSWHLVSFGDGYESASSPGVPTLALTTPGGLVFGLEDGAAEYKEEAEEEEDWEEDSWSREVGVDGHGLMFVKRDAQNEVLRGCLSPLQVCTWQKLAVPSLFSTGSGPQLKLETPEGEVFYLDDLAYYPGESCWADLDEED